MLVELKSVTGPHPASRVIFVRRGAVDSLAADTETTTLVRTPSYNFLVEGSIEEIAVLLDPDLAPVGPSKEFPL